MDLTTCYIDATMARDFSTSTPPPPPDRPPLLFLSFLEFPYLLLFLSLAASLGPHKNSSPLFPITCRLFSQKHGGGLFLYFSNFALRFSARLIFQFRFSIFPRRSKFIRMNTYRRVSKQMTSTPLQSHSYEKPRGEGGYIQKSD